MGVRGVRGTAFRLFSLYLLSSMAWGCDSLMNSPDPYSPTGGPGANQGRTTRRDDVPYCPGGKRDRSCLFGTNCRITEKGCQVCQCEGLDD